ncbi:hypothetical protein KFK09_001062 [Dendrobium nobile]|uniref:Uncharacterized protein n=1 Tax=Dendrobium nobile TaxID=94219 RepID=A0A8T3CCT8_DENNO|nr:hypothetical protein KFK09_001062 [Dendrobium nobile]
MSVTKKYCVRVRSGRWRKSTGGGLCNAVASARTEMHAAWLCFLFSFLLFYTSTRLNKIWSLGLNVEGFDAARRRLLAQRCSGGRLHWTSQGFV